jgi:hypothetical protein
MPHAELKYSSDLTLDAAAVFEVIEATILEHDGASGACKCRAYPTDGFRHTHMIVSVSLLAKPNRNAAFTAALLADLETRIKAQVHQRCFFSVMVEYSPSSYITNLHDPVGG